MAVGASHDAHGDDHVVARHHNRPSGLVAFDEQPPVAGQGHEGHKEKANHHAAVQFKGVKKIHVVRGLSKGQTKE